MELHIYILDIVQRLLFLWNFSFYYLNAFPCQIMEGHIPENKSYEEYDMHVFQLICDRNQTILYSTY